MLEQNLLSLLSYVKLDMLAKVHLYLEQMLEFHNHFLTFNEKGILDFHCMTMLSFVTLQ
ncbi:MAG: hypothetical protein L0Z71_08540 [Anaerolineae bacterium]|nr:hypothetical protein [Anaerolineae bacterium]